MNSASAISISFLESFFAKLESENIRYCILRNENEVREGDAHDVDMCIESTRLLHAESILAETAANLNWKLHLKTGSPCDTLNIKCYNYFYIDEATQEITIIHIDFFPTCTWKGLELIPNEVLLQDTDTSSLYHSAAPWVTAVVNLFTRLFYNGYIKEKYKPQIHKLYSTEPEKVKRTMLCFLPEEIAEQMIHEVCNLRWTDIEQNRTKIVNAAKKQAKRRSLVYYRYLLSKALRPAGIVVAFQGTDGSGKSTIINGLPAVIGNTFSDNTLNYYHWRPGYLKAEKKYDEKGELLSNVQPHTKSQHGVMLSLFKLSFHTLDYIFGYWCKVRWQAAQGHLVIFDRYYYDFYMDKIRYRLSVPNFIIRLFQFFVPSPRITFLLVGNAKQIFERKKELSIDEIQNQIDILLHYKNHFGHPVIIDVNKNITNVLYDVSKTILQTLAKNYS